MTRVYSSEWLDVRKNVLRFQCLVSNCGVLLYQVTVIVKDEQVLDVHTVVFSFEAAVGVARDVSDCVTRSVLIARGDRSCDDYNGSNELFD